MLVLDADYVVGIVVNERRCTSNALISCILILESLRFAMSKVDFIVELWLPTEAVVGVCKEICDTLRRAYMSGLCHLICCHLWQLITLFVALVCLLDLFLIIVANIV